MAVTDLLTSVLLFAQFSILRTKALLVISSGYLFTGLMAVPWMLTFPGAFTPEGLLGAGLHTTSWIYILWHGGFPLFVLGYALLKDQDGPVKQVWPGSIAVAIWASVVMVVVMVAGLTLLVTAGHDLVLQVNATPARGNLTQEIILGIDTLLAGLALLVLLAPPAIGPRSLVDDCHVRIHHRDRCDYVPALAPAVQRWLV